MARTLEHEVRLVEAVRFVSDMIPSGWIPKNSSPRRNNNIKFTVGSDVIVVGNNGLHAHFDHGTEVVIYRLPNPGAYRIMASCFTNPPGGRDTIVNIMTDGSVVFRAGRKAQPALRKATGRPSALD